MASGTTASASTPTQAVPPKMLEGAESRLRKLWKHLHGINLSGAWLASEPIMTQMYLGLHAPQKTLYVPDMSTILRKSMLHQKQEKGTLITEHGVQQFDYTMSPCTTPPEYFLRVRSYIMTIAFIVVATPDFFPFETALELVDYIFDAINFRPDGRRPGLVQLTQCYLSMFGDDAKHLQNSGTTLERDASAA